MNTKRKLNGFDLVLIVVIVLMILGLVVKLAIQNRDSDADAAGVSVTYTLSVTPVRSYTVEQLQVGDTIYYESTSDAMGVITEIEVLPATATVTTSAGEVLEVTYEDRYELILTIEATAVASDDYGGCWQISEVSLLENRSDSYHTKYQAFSATMLTVDADT